MKNVFELYTVKANGGVGIVCKELNGKKIRPLFWYREQAEAILSEEFQVQLGQFIDQHSGVLTKVVSKEEKEIKELEERLAALKANKQAA